MGLDINIGQSPPAPWLPKNMSMRTWSVTEEPPPELVGYFDIVQIRMFMLVIKDNDPLPVLKNVLKLLSMHYTRHVVLEVKQC